MTTPQPPESLGQKVDRLDKSVAELTHSITFAATKRSTFAIGIAVLALFLLVAGGIANAAIQRHDDCERGNEVRAAILVSDRISTEAFINGLVETLTVGRTPEQIARTRAQAEALQAAVDADSDLIAARTSLSTRECNYIPF